VVTKINFIGSESDDIGDHCQHSSVLIYKLACENKYKVLVTSNVVITTSAHVKRTAASVMIYIYI
jgi:hypothetical protein